MAKIARPLASSIGKKVITTITGLALCLFLVFHLAGNLLLLLGHGEAFNHYSAFLNALPFLIVVELGLVAIILIHSYEALTITLDNRAARPVGYSHQAWARTKSENSRKTRSSTTMAVSGSILLIFIVLHVIHFKYGHYYTVPVDASASGAAQQQTMRDLYYLVVTQFKRPWITALYVFSMAVLGAHLYHAVWASSQTLGAQNKRWRRWMLWLGTAFTLIVAVGFAFLPLWAYFIAPMPAGGGG